MFLSYFRTKLRKKIFFFTKILCFIYFLCIGIDLVPQKTLIQKVQFKLWKNNPGPQADTASYTTTTTITAVSCMIQTKVSENMFFSEFLVLLDAEASLCPTPVSQLVPLSELGCSGASASPQSWIGLLSSLRFQSQKSKGGFL